MMRSGRDAQGASHELPPRGRARRLLSTFALALLAGNGWAQEPATQPVAPDSATSAPVLPGDATVASRGGVSVTLAEIDARMAQMAPELRAGYMNDPERIQMLILNMLLEKQLAELGREQGLDQKRLFAIQAQQTVDRLLGSQAVEHHVATLEEPDFAQLALERYMADSGTNVIPESLELTQILVKPTGRGEEEARRLAEEARAKAIAGEVPFEQLVRDYNEGNPRDGKLPGIARGHTVPEFEKAAFALREPGDVSAVVQTRFGFHVIRLDKRTPEKKLPFEAVRDKLVADLRKEWTSRQGRMLRERLNNIPLEADPDAVASLRTRYLPEHSPLKDYADPAGAVQE